LSHNKIELSALHVSVLDFLCVWFVSKPEPG